MMATIPNTEKADGRRQKADGEEGRRKRRLRTHLKDLAMQWKLMTLTQPIWSPYTSTHLSTAIGLDTHTVD